MNVLVVSTMFPNRAQPVHAVFVRNRVLRIAERCNIRIINPIRWFPGAWILRKYSHRRHIPSQDSMDGVTVDYPRFLSIPRFLKSLEGPFLFLSLLWLARRLRATFRFQLIDAHLAYPDGFACALLARVFNVPFTITLRGHDVNDVPKYPVRRRQVAYALRRATRVIAVAEALRRAAIELGAEAKKSVTVPNGVNAKIFYPLDRDEARRRLDLPRDRKIVVAVGHLVERKGFHLIVEALQHLWARGAHGDGGAAPYLVIIGAAGEEGDFLSTIRAAIARHGLEKDVLMAGAQLNHTLRDWYNAADVSCLASSKEGWANVLLESLACGTPVVATNVWGTPEVIPSAEYGVLIERTSPSIAAGLETALTKRWDRTALAEYARTQTWDRVADKVLAVFVEALDGCESPSSPTAVHCSGEKSAS